MQVGYELQNDFRLYRLYRSSGSSTVDQHIFNKKTNQYLSSVEMSIAYEIATLRGRPEAGNNNNRRLSVCTDAITACILCLVSLLFDPLDLNLILFFMPHSNSFPFSTIYVNRI